MKVEHSPELTALTLGVKPRGTRPVPPVEIPLAVLGAVAVATIEPLLPYAMGFAAGAMLFVISDEIIPETHQRGYERIASLGLMAGVIVMLYLDIALAA